MQVINWLDLKLSQEEVLAARQELGQIAPTRVFLKNLIRQIVMQYPWRDRSDTIDLFDPSKSYCADKYIAFPKEDPQELRPTSWKIGVIKEIVPASNPLQGAFQVLFVSIDGDLFKYASDVPDASPFEVRIPINDNDSLELFVNQNVDLYENSIISNLKDQASDLGIQISDNIILIGEIQDDFTSDQLYVLDEIIKEHAKEEIIISIIQIIRDLENWDFNQYSELELKYLLEEYLSKNGFTELGNGQWIKSEDQQKLQRPIQKRPEVPRNTSILIDLLNITETELDEIKQSQLPGDVIPNILEYGDFQEDSGDSVATTWEPPSTEIKLPIVTYQNILEGFFNLSKELRKAFPPSEGYFIPNIQIGESEYLPFVVDYYENVLKTMDEDGASILRQEIPHAGIKLWIEYQHNNNYRIFAKPLEKPVNHRCKIAKWDDDGNLQFEETEIPVRFEHEKNIFKAEIRLVDKKALFKEAEDIQYSIQDCVLLAFQELTEISADGLVHQNEVFNAVFFKYRMSSPHTVLSLLYELPCFVPVGGGYFKFKPEFGLKVKGKTKTQLREINYFTFQQKPDTDTEYDNKTDENIDIRIWLTRLLNLELFTLYRKVPFKIDEITEDSIHITAERTEHNIKISRIVQSWADLKRRGEIDNGYIWSKYSRKSSEYIAAILSNFDGVTYNDRPLKLFYNMADLIDQNDLDYYLGKFDPFNYIGWTVVHQRKLGGYEDLWANYFKFLQNNPKARENEIITKTDIHWRGSMHARYLGFITENKEVTLAGRSFINLSDKRKDLLHQQLQKWYYCVDLFCKPNPDYSIFPYFAILKILLGLSDHLVSVDEMKYFVLPTRKMEDCEKQIRFIEFYRDNKEKYKQKLESTFQYTYIGRIGHLLELSPIIEVTGDYFNIKSRYTNYANELLQKFTEYDEKGLIPHYKIWPTLYLNMLRSDQDMFEYISNTNY